MTSSSRFLLPALLCTAVISPVQAQPGLISGNTFNPAISLVLDGRYSDHHERFALPGFQSGGEAGAPDQGFSLGHTELSLSASIDDRFYGQAAVALHEHDGATETELEEAFVETLGLDHGLTVKAGRFFSQLGYLNGQHEHAWDFADAPLVYMALFGNRLRDDGVQLRWLAPTERYLELGAELTRGDRFPSGANAGNRGRVLFAKTGGDLGAHASWQLGASAYRSDFQIRESTAHDHGHDDGHEHGAFALEDGEVKITGLDAVFKWAPGGNPMARQWVLQGEYFRRAENATLTAAAHGHPLLADYDGVQSGWYLQAVYRFMPGWRVGVRYDHLEADNEVVTQDDELLHDSGFDSRDPIRRRSLMFDWSRSEFARIRLQYGYVDLPHGRDELVLLQYTMSLGAHGAHRY